MLIRRGADPRAARQDGTTPLHVAAAYGTLATVQALLDGGADPRRRDERWATPLHLAATPQPDRSGDDCRRIIEALVAHGADPNARNGYGMAPLHMAALHGHVVALQALLAAGARVDLEGPARGTPMIWPLTATMVSFAPAPSGICVPTAGATGAPAVVVAAAEFQPVTQVELLVEPL
jgi:cytohesin